MYHTAIRISDATLPLITILNGGVEPSRSAFGDYFICTIEDAEHTTDHKIISMEEYRTTIARFANRVDINWWTK